MVRRAQLLSMVALAAIISGAAAFPQAKLKALDLIKSSNIENKQKTASPLKQVTARSLIAASDAGDDKPDLDALMERFDEDKNGVLNEEEFVTLYTEMFEDSHAGHGGHGGDSHDDDGDSHDDHGDHEDIKIKHPKDEDGKCFDPDAIILAADAGGDGNLNETELASAATVLADMALEKCVIEEEKCEKMDVGLQWLAALLSGIVISLLSLLAVALFPVAQNKMIMLPMLAFAVGALVGDSILHLIPASLGVHGHGEEESAEEEDEKAFLGPATLTLVGVLLFFAMERQLSHFHSHSHSHGNVGSTDEEDEIDMEKRKIKEEGTNFRTKQTARVGISSSDGEDDSGSASDSNSDSDSVDAIPADSVSLDSTDSTTASLPWFKKIVPTELQYQPLGYMSLVADGLHNFVDGIAIGASYTVSFSAGMATTIAVFCHELPQELAEFTILIRSGFSKKKAIVWNLITGFTNVLGCMIGLAIGQAVGAANKYIVAFIAGGFLYIALSDMVLELLKEKGAKQTLIQCTAILFGFTLMLILALFAEDISIECEKEHAGHDDH